MESSLKITPEGKVFLNGAEIKRCTAISISNITADREFKVEIKATVGALDIQYMDSPLRALHERNQTLNLSKKIKNIR